MTQSILNGFLIFSIIQAVLFAGLFVSKKNRFSADFFIASLLLLVAIHSFLILVNLNHDYSTIVQTIPITITLLYGPLILIYVNRQHTGIGEKNGQILLHSLPFLIFLLLTSFFSHNPIFQIVLSFSGAFSGLLYCVLALFALKKHEDKIVDLYSSSKGVSLNWLKKMVVGIVFIWVGVFTLVAFKQLLQSDIQMNWFFIAIPLFITYIGYHGLKQQVIFQVEQLDNVKSKSEIATQDTTKQPFEIDSRYEKSNLSNQDMEKLFNSLEMLMKSEKLYLESQLNLKDLAEKANVPPHYITQTLNSYAKQNFYDYVNSYRIYEFIQRLKNGDADNFSLLGIAFDCGFNSKSSFNRIFKKVTGFSPSEYKKHRLIND